MSIGNKLKTKRNQLKLTMDDVANALKVSRQTIYKYENGIIKNIPLDKINKLAELLEVSPTYLTGWEEKWNEKFLVTAHNVKQIEADVHLFKLLGYNATPTPSSNGHYEEQFDDEGNYAGKAWIQSDDTYDVLLVKENEKYTLTAADIEVLKKKLKEFIGYELYKLKK